MPLRVLFLQVQIYDRIQSLEAEVRELRAQSVPPAPGAKPKQHGRGSIKSDTAQKDSPVQPDSLIHRH